MLDVLFVLGLHVFLLGSLSFLGLHVLTLSSARNCKQCIHPTKEFTWIKPHERTKDGNAAYWAIKHVMLGPGVTRALRASADKIIQTSKYDGKDRKGYTFDKLVTRLTEAFIDSGIDWDEERKVQKLLETINDSSLSAAKHAIMASLTLRQNYQDSVNYLQELIST